MAQISPFVYFFNVEKKFHGQTDIWIIEAPFLELPNDIWLILAPLRVYSFLKKIRTVQPTTDRHLVL